MKLFFKVLILSSMCKVFFFMFLFFCVSSVWGLNQSTFKQDSITIEDLNKQGFEAMKMGDFENALIFYRKSLHLCEKIYGGNNLKLFLPLINTGIIYKNLGNYNNAVEAYFIAEQLIKRKFGENNPRLGFVYSNLGTIFKIQGDYPKSYEFHKASLAALSNDPSNYQDQIEIAKINLVESSYYLKLYNKAIALSMSNLNRVDDDIKSYYTSLLARIYAQTGNISLAERYYLETFRILKKLYGEDSYELGLEYSAYVTFLISVNRLDQVPEYNEKARNIISKYFTEKSTQYSEVMLNQGDYLFSRTTEANGMDDFRKKRREDLHQALVYYQKAIIAGTSTFSNADPFSNPMPNQAVSEIHLLQIMKKKSRCLQVLGDLNLSDQRKGSAVDGYKAALNAIQLSAGLIHQIRTGFVSEESRLVLSESEESVFPEAVNLCYKLYQQTNDVNYAYDAFKFMERGKSASFLAAVTDFRAKKLGNIPDSLATKEQVLKKNISSYKEMLFEEKQQEKPDSAKLALYSTKLFEYSERHSELIKYLEKYFPDYYAFKYKTDVASVPEVREKLNGRETLVEYLFDNPHKEGENGYLFRVMISSNDFLFTRQEIKPAFLQDIADVHGFLTNTAYLYTGLDDYRKYVRSAFRLQQQLLGDLRPVLTDKHLIIVPDDQLAYIPFDALLSAMPDTTSMNFRDLAYLVHDFPISYTYSATLLYSYFSKEKEAKNDLLAFAPGYRDDDRDVSQIAKERAGLLPLPFVSKEVEYINQYIPGDVFKGSLAGEDRFKALAGDYDILHLAMHTILNDSLPLYSGLAFSKPANGSKEDGWLNTGEIYNLVLKARMAVLSACNTGTGKLQKGEGVMSLARGFLYAGCPSIIMSLWEVDDESGSLIMKDFYRLLSKGKSKDEALQLAKLEHIRNADPLKAHPHYWLGYVAVGNTEPLFVSRDVYFVFILFVLVLLFAADQLYRKKRRTRN